MIINNLKLITALAVLLSSSACNAQPSTELTKLSTIDNDWHTLSIGLVFNDKQYAYPLITSFADNTGRPRQTYEGDLYKAPFNQLKPILATVKSNPFQQAFRDIYQAISTGQYGEHEFTGLQFELDDNPATSEWLVAFQFTPCSNNGAGDALATTCGDEQIHSWVIQQSEAGNYHVVMESDGLMVFSKSQQVAGYKSITTQAFNEHNYLSEADNTTGIDHPPCGRGEIEWRYENEKYQPIKLTATKGSCDLRFIGDNETIEEFSERTEPGVRHYLSTWLKKLTGKPL